VILSTGLGVPGTAARASRCGDMITLRIRHELPLFVLVALAACAPLPETSGGSNAPQAAADTAIEIRPGACFGTCPMYSVSVDRADRIDFRPERFTRVETPVQRQGTSGTFGRVAALVAPLRPASPGESDISQQCESVTTDLPDYHIRWSGPDGVRAIRFYPGCINASTESNERRISDAIREYRIEDLVVRAEDPPSF
jgi:hypothetical protein